MPAPGAAHDELSLDRTVDRQTDAATNARVLYLRLRYEEVSRGVNKRLTCCTQSRECRDVRRRAMCDRWPISVTERAVEAAPACEEVRDEQCGIFTCWLSTRSTSMAVWSGDDY